MHYKNPKISHKTICKFITILTLAIANILCGSCRANAQSQSKPAENNNSLFDNIFNIKSRPKRIPNWLEKEAEYKADKAAGFDSQAPYTGIVQKVIDGNTFAGQVGSVIKTFRTSLNDAPESDQMYGKEAKAALQKHLPEGSTFRGVPTMDHRGREPKYNRPLATVYNQEGKSVAEEMVKEGLSYPAYLDHTTKSDELRNLGSEAGHANKGMYAENIAKQTEHGIVQGYTSVLPANWRTFSESQKAEEWKKHQAAKARKSIDPRPEEAPQKNNGGSKALLTLGIAGAVAVGSILATRTYNSRENQEKRRRRREAREEEKG